ncbi:hypothetical protein [Natrarchaeobaculum sulfurireducens]|uniref:Uncharacterized protein n=1 Tax=Natrarchaeobaculum sulfurireducens TaxID=2044521 RepID=A0A346PDD1_9EURY|nr:hypothetical protein [Natrarchaeobaculum sulfurireducens]AXR77526.1 hypothetical protein AArc1_1186 [Natrarchaeobaculum sulfurireducens]AXR82531.1 hypothetical protein AArcMg_2540 [Natrarchaeobaculum sulfurireducens]
MYGESFGTDWATIDDRDEVVLRAYALGVAVRLGEEWPDELERLAAQVQTAYDRSFVQLAYRKGRDEAAAASVDDDRQIWEELVEEKTTITPLERDDDRDRRGSDATSLPDALGMVDIDSLPPDSTQRVRRPSFLDRESDSRPSSRDQDRTVFGRPVSDVQRDDVSRGNGPDDGDSPDMSTAAGEDESGSNASESEESDRPGDDHSVDDESADEA